MVSHYCYCYCIIRKTHFVVWEFRVKTNSISIDYRSGFNYNHHNEKNTNIYELILFFLPFFQTNFRILFQIKKLKYYNNRLFRFLHLCNLTFYWKCNFLSLLKIPSWKQCLFSCPQVYFHIIFNFNLYFNIFLCRFYWSLRFYYVIFTYISPS